MIQIFAVLYSKGKFFAPSYLVWKGKVSSWGKAKKDIKWLWSNSTTSHPDRHVILIAYIHISGSGDTLGGWKVILPDPRPFSCRMPLLSPVCSNVRKCNDRNQPTTTPALFVAPFKRGMLKRAPQARCFRQVSSRISFPAGKSEQRGAVASSTIHLYDYWRSNSPTNRRNVRLGKRWTRYWKPVTFCREQIYARWKWTDFVSFFFFFLFFRLNFTEK